MVRPHGQRLRDGTPVFGPSTRLDFEAEVGFLLGPGTPQGSSIAVADFAEHVFGAFLLNDWSARDLQAWEYVPLGPFLGKSFATSVSPWAVPLDALGAARVAPPPWDPELLPYLRDADAWGSTSFATTYWTPAQQLAHLTVNGVLTRPGDIFVSGTVSGPDRHQRGSLLELTGGGTEPMELPDGSARRFLADGDEVVMTAIAPGPGGSRIGFGAVRGAVQPA